MSTFTTDGSPISESELRSRQLPLVGIFNLREVGGYPAEGGWVRRRRLFRSSALHRLDDQGREALRELGIRTVVDLRDDDERTAAPNRLEGVGARVVPRPLFDRRPLPSEDAGSGSGPDLA
ncbi:MAG: hypothetical protein EPN50_07375, partial [Chloroflexota bacterium]